MSTFYISDTHFGHTRIIELCNRPFSDVDTMNNTLIENWNHVVKPNDTVFHLGDVALGTIADTLPLISLLNGYKILLPGNHDRISMHFKQAHRERFMPEYKKYFDEIWDENGVVRQIQLDNGYFIDVLLCHYPYSGDSYDPTRFIDSRPKDKGLPLIHGHVHNQWTVHNRQFNVGVDVHEFMPVNESDIIQWLSTLG